MIELMYCPTRIKFKLGLNRAFWIYFTKDIFKKGTKYNPRTHLFYWTSDMGDVKGIF